MPAPHRRSIPCRAFCSTLLLLTAHPGAARAAPAPGPQLSNDAVTCRWAAPERGGGLLAMVALKLEVIP